MVLLLELTRTKLPAPPHLPKCVQSLKSSIFLEISAPPTPELWHLFLTRPNAPYLKTRAPPEEAGFALSTLSRPKEMPLNSIAF